MGRSARKPTVWTLPKVSNRIGLSLPRFFVSEIITLYLYTPETECVGPALHYAESIMLYFSWNSSFLKLDELPDAKWFYTAKMDLSQMLPYNFYKHTSNLSFFMVYIYTLWVTNSFNNLRHSTKICLNKLLSSPTNTNNSAVDNNIYLQPEYSIKRYLAIRRNLTQSLNSSIN